MKQLQYLVALADTQHFGRAAERCYITQSTLSAGIRDLEAVLGIPIAERSNRHVLITRVGMRIAERARALLRDAEEVMELARAGRSPMTGEMRLGVIPTISPFLLPRILPLLRERFPELTIYLTEEQTALILTRLEEGELDAALIALPYETEDLNVDVIFEDEFLFACHRTHALAGTDEFSLEALAGEHLMLLSEGHCLRGHTLEVCGVGRHQGAGAVRGQQPAHAGTDGRRRHRRHPDTTARDRRETSFRERVSRSQGLRPALRATSDWHGARHPSEPTNSGYWRGRCASCPRRRDDSVRLRIGGQAPKRPFSQ